MIIQRRVCLKCGKEFGCVVKEHGEKVKKKCIWCFRPIVLWECPKGKVMKFDNTDGVCPMCYVIWRIGKFLQKLKRKWR